MTKEQVFFNYQSAHQAGVPRHAQTVMDELSKQCGFQVIEARPETMGDGWRFIIEWPGEVGVLPPYVLRGAPYGGIL
jgi:hypothetical protein